MKKLLVLLVICNLIITLFGVSNVLNSANLPSEFINPNIFNQAQKESISKMSERMSYEWDIDWDIQGKNTCNYDVFGDCTHEIIFEVIEEVLTETYRIESQYDNSNNIIQVDYFVNNVNTSRNYYIYDENNLLSQSTYYHIDAILGDESLSGKTSQIYNNEQQLIESIYSYFDGDGFVPNEKLCYQYEDNRMMLREHKICFSGQWTDSDKIEYLYNANNQLESKKSYSYNSDLYVWGLIDEYFYEYDENSNVSCLTYITDYYINQPYRYLYEYENNLLVNEITQRYDDDTEIWVNLNRGNYEYENNLLVSKITQNYDGENEVWVNIYKVDYTYTEITDNDSSEIALTSLQLNSYPNPFNPETTISYNIEKASNVSLVVYNIKGQKVKALVQGFNQAGNHDIVWDGKDNSNSVAASGIYYLRLEANEQSSLRKITLIK